VNRIAGTFAIVAVTGACSVAARSPASLEGSPVLADSLVRGPLVFVAEAHVADEFGVSRLTVVLRVRNLTDAIVQFESESDNCEPRLEFASTTSSRGFLWDHVAWRRRHEPLSPPPFNDVTCVGTGLILTLPGNGNTELGHQSYPVRQILGDSVTPGSYRVRVPAVIFDGSRRHVVSLWSEPVELR
jgi:hypothetical protein